jgi:hypothetical protein
MGARLVAQTQPGGSVKSPGGIDSASFLREVALCCEM